LLPLRQQGCLAHPLCAAHNLMATTFPVGSDLLWLLHSSSFLFLLLLQSCRESFERLTRTLQRGHTRTDDFPHRACCFFRKKRERGEI
jgi:hypothetical protein